MKKLFLFLLMSGMITPLMAQSSEAASQSPNLIVTILCGILIILGSLAMLGHMIYENFIRKAYRTDYSVEGFRLARKEAGQNEEMTDEELQYYANRLDEINDAWGEIPDEEGNPIPFPLKKSGIQKANEVLKEVVAAHPTNEMLVEKINACGEILNTALERNFNGSKAIIITSIIVAGLIGWAAEDINFVIYIGCSLAVYWLASRTASFVLIRKEMKGVNTGNSFLTGILGGLFGGVAAAKTYKTITTYSDGSQTTETDDSQTWISLIFAIIVIVILVVFLWFFSLINYLRNYIFYR